MTADISVIICAYTEARWNDLVAAVTSVQRQQLRPREIIVVIDHNLRLLEQIRSRISGVIPLENRESRGLSGARNTGVAAAQGAILAFLDDDAIAAPDWLEQMNAGYADRQVLGVGGAIEPLWLSGRPSWFPDEFDWVVGCTYRGLPQATAPVRNLIGANMSFRRELFAGVAGFQNGIGRVGTVPLGCEESEFCIRIKQRWPRHRLLYEPRAKVYHKVPAGRAHWRYFFARCYGEGRSKALVSHFVGARDGLASERAYTVHTLPRGVVKGVMELIGNGDRCGLARAAAIMAGLTATAIGFLVGLATHHATRTNR